MARQRKHRDPEDVLRQIMRRARVGLLAAGHHLEEKTVTMLSQPGYGRWYRSRRPGMGDHRASRPGDPPAADTGFLRDSIATVDMTRGDEPRVRTGSGADYAPFLEFGRRDMAPRPFMRPAYQMARRRMTQLLVRYLRGVR